jgi:GTPase involved in cell partitioning and DNA repair
VKSPTSPPKKASWTRIKSVAKTGGNIVSTMERASDLWERFGPDGGEGGDGDDDDLGELCAQKQA